MTSNVLEILKRPYSWLLVAEAEGGFSAQILEFSGCFADGETPGEAAAELGRAAEAWVEGALEDQQPVPEPGDYLQLPKEFVQWLMRFYLATQYEHARTQDQVVAVMAKLIDNMTRAKIPKHQQEKLRALAIEGVV